MDLESTVAGHVIEIQNIKENLQQSEQRQIERVKEAENRAMTKIREVQEDMKEQLKLHGERIGEIQDDVKELRKEVPQALNAMRKAAPTWAMVIITALGVIVGLIGSFKP